MPAQIQTNTDRQAHPESSAYAFGFIALSIIIVCTLADIIAGTALGGNLLLLPQNAVDRFEQFSRSWLLGLYNLDLLNLITTLLMVPVYFAIYMAHRRLRSGTVALACLIFAIATAIFATNNAALAMLDLSRKYQATTDAGQRLLYAAAGEALLARGAHGSPGVFLGFSLSSLASIILSIGMLRGRIFTRLTAWCGIVGGLLLLMYLILVTFLPGTGAVAMAVAAPGGILSLVWLILSAIRLHRLSRQPVPEQSSTKDLA